MQEATYRKVHSALRPKGHQAERTKGQGPPRPCYITAG